MDFLTQIALIELTGMFISCPNNSRELAEAICDILPDTYYAPYVNMIYFKGTGMPFAVGP